MVFARHRESTCLALCQKIVYYLLTEGALMDSIHDKIANRIQRQGRGKVLTPKDFLDLASRAAADQTLSRLVRAGDLERLGRGLYHYPRVNQRLGIALSPDVDEIAQALGR